MKINETVLTFETSHVVEPHAMSRKLNEQRIALYKFYLLWYVKKEVKLLTF